MSEIKIPPKLFPTFIEEENILDPTRIDMNIRKILELFPNACWGGSSVLHDIVLPPIEKTDKSWDTRDFDVYCFEKDYEKIICFLKTCPNVIFIRAIPNMKKMRYANLEIKGLTEYRIKINGGFEKKLQLVNIGNYSDYSNLYNSIDLSFCSVIVSNNMVYYLRTTKSDILSKRGILLRTPCMCSTCVKNNKNRLNIKISERIKKYRLRGFTITNICQFCDYSINTMEHVPCCLARKLFNKHIDHLHCILHSHTFKLEIDEINKLISYSHQYKDNSIIQLSIYSIFTHFKRIDLLHSFWEGMKTSVDVLSLMKCSEQLINEGLYTGFRLLFEFFVIHQINTIHFDELQEYIRTLMNIVVERNFIQCAVLIQSHISTIELNIYEDKIFYWKNRIVYDTLFELINDESNQDDNSQEIDSLMKMIPFVKKLPEDDPSREMVCPICKYDNCSRKMTCGHSFCQNCIILQLLSSYTNLKKEMCPCCRTEFNYLTKKHIIIVD